MATGTSRKTRQDRQHRAGQADKEAQDRLKQQLEQIEEGEEVTADKARRLAPQLGNQALANLLATTKGSSSTASGTGADVEVVEEGPGEDQEAEVDEGGLELETPHFGGGGGDGGADGGGGAGEEEDPWDLGFLFGGDDDDDGGPNPRRRLGPSPRRAMPSPEDPFERDEIEKALGIEHVPPVEAIAGRTRPRPEAPREGDGVYAAVEAALDDAAFLARGAVEPEDLVEIAGALDPLGRPVEIARFLAGAARSVHARSLSRVIAGNAAALLPEAGGHSGGVARLATLAACAEAFEGGGPSTDRAVRLALVREAWTDAVAAAREGMKRGRLYAPDIVARVHGRPPAGSRRRLPEPSPLGGRALAHVVPLGHVPAIPDVDPRPPAPEDPDLADFDAVLAVLTGGEDPRETPADPPLDDRHLAPVLRAANDLINALGRTQVELAAAGVAVTRVRLDAPVRGVLAHADEALRELARSAFSTGHGIERLRGRPFSEAEDRARHLVARLRATATGLEALREWAVERLAGALDAA